MFPINIPMKHRCLSRLFLYFDRVKKPRLRTVYTFIINAGKIKNVIFDLIFKTIIALPLKMLFFSSHYKDLVKCISFK